MIVLARHTGLRMGELLGLQWRDIDLKVGRLTVRRACVRGEIVTPKSGKARELRLNANAIAALQSLPRGALWVFSTTRGICSRSASASGRCGGRARRRGWRRIGWHALRHTFAGHLVMRGAPLKVVQELLGHAMIEMTMRYAHLRRAPARGDA
jgi:integrase